ncbi:MAG: Verru_Chthon cassette protein C [Verrucomicrobiota bacterium]
MKHSKKAESKQNISSAFTLAELLVSMTVLSVLLLMLTQLLTQVQRTWTYSEARISQFREARVAFDIISKNLSQATLHTYLDYERDNNNQVTKYKRQSELHFKTMQASQLGTNKPTHAIFFQAPLGTSDKYQNLGNLFNARGYYVEYGNDRMFKPAFVQAEPKYRFRLMEYLPPAEENQIYVDGDKERLVSPNGVAVYDKWYRYKLDTYSHPLAENVIGLIASPREALTNPSQQNQTYSSIAPNYSYDSNEQNANFALYVQQVPPLVKVTMVAIDETSAIRLEDKGGGGASMPSLIPGSFFKSTQQYESDIAKLKAELNSRKINFKIFSTTVAIRSSKWSTQ